MRRLVIAVILAMVLPWCVSLSGASAQRSDGVSALTVSDAFVKLPAGTLDLLATSMRKDLLDYYRNDSIYRVRNTMQGLSYLERPVTDQYLKVHLTHVTTMTLRLLQSKKGPVVMTVYTVGDSIQAHDSEIAFFDSSMTPLKRDKLIKLASTEDFLDTKSLDRHERDELSRLVPFPTVEYNIGETGDTLTARLTVGEFLGKETMEKLTPHLIRERKYLWDGSKFKLIPLK